jgi:hypothetical protein
MISQKELIDLCSGKKGLELRSQLYLHFSKHKIFSYPRARKLLFENVKHKCIYRKNSMPDNSLSCEHIIPQSLYNSEKPYVSDLHHLFKCDPFMNFYRSNFKFKELNQITSVKLDYTDPECSQLYKGKFQPNTLSKGKVSRAIAYFVVTYPEKIHLLPKVINIKDMLNWNDQYPPELDEIKRNKDIWKIQYNCNPFIICPDIMRKTFIDLYENKDEDNSYNPSNIPNKYYDKTRQWKFVREEMKLLHNKNKKLENNFNNLLECFIELQKFQEQILKKYHSHHPNLNYNEWVRKNNGRNINENNNSEGDGWNI